MELGCILLVLAFFAVSFLIAEGCDRLAGADAGNVPARLVIEFAGGQV